VQLRPCGYQTAANLNLQNLSDQCYSGFWGPMVLVYFVSADGCTEWEVEAYESELEPLETATNQTLHRTGAAKKHSWFKRFFGRGPGR
jgi:hypothetical protein